MMDRQASRRIVASKRGGRLQQPTASERSGNVSLQGGTDAVAPTSKRGYGRSSAYSQKGGTGYLRLLGLALLALTTIAVILWRVVVPWVTLRSSSTGGAVITWSQTQGPTGGKINALLVNSQNPSTIYAGTDGGVYSSQDGAVTWQLTSEGLPAGQEITTLAMASASPRAEGAVAEPYLYAGTVAGVYRSVDGGRTWLPAKEGLARRLILSLVVDPSDSAVIYAATDGQVFKSTDGGEQWSRSSEGLPPETVWSLAVDPTHAGTVYAGTDSSIFVSRDGGRRWQHADGDPHQAGTNGLPEPLRIQGLAIDAQSSSVLYAATEAGLYRSTDSGVTWQAARGGLENNIIHAVVIDPSNTNILYAAVGVQGVWQSSDAAETWEPVGGNIEELVLSLAINPAHSRVLYAGTGRGVYYSSSAGQRWDPGNDGLRNTNVLSLVAVPTRPGGLFATTGLDVYKTLDDGRTWSSVNYGFAHPNVLALAVSPASPDTLYAGTWYSEIYRSLDGGRSWRLVNGSLARNAPVTALAVQCAAPDSSSQSETESPGRVCGALFAATNGAGVFFSADDGNNWTAINDGLADLHVQVLALTLPGWEVQSGWSVRGAASPSGVLYAGTGDGVCRLRLAGGARTTESPPSSYDVATWVWEPVRQGLPGDEVHSLVVDEQEPNVLYAATAGSLGEIYRSADGGDSWIATGGGSLPTNIKIQSLALYTPRRNKSILSRKGGTAYLYAGTDGGVFRSEDGGQNWRAINDGLPSGANVLAMLVDADRSYLYSSVKNNGIYQSVEQLPSGVSLPLALVAMLGVVALSAAAMVWARQLLQSSRQAQEQTFERNWPTWREEIRCILQEKNAVTMEALPDIPQTLRLRALRQYVEEHGDDALVVRLNPPTLAPANVVQVGGFLRNWRAARKRLGSAVAFRPIASRITDQLCQLLGFTLLETRSYKQLHGYMVKAPALRLKMPPMFPIVFLQTAEPTEEHFRDLRDLMGILNASSYLALLVVPGAATAEHGSGRDGVPTPTKVSLRKLASGTAHDFVVMDLDDLYRIFVAKDPEKTFARILLGQVDLTVVSPYVTSGPVPENMFFGRDYELKTITRTIKGNSFAIVGGRKIGKTSILTKLHRLFTEAPDCHSLYLDCQAVQSYEEFCNALETMWQVTLPSHSPEGIQRLIARMRQELAASIVSCPEDGESAPGPEGAGTAPRPEDGETAPSPEADLPAQRRDLIILLDEVDGLLKYDAENGERLFKVFRALSQEAYCRFVFCGGKVLHLALHDPDSALFNFCNIVRLSYLTARDTGRVVIEPLQGMGIGFEDASRLVQGIIELSSCHPNIVQYLCQELILRINARGDRFITQTDLDVIASSSRLSEYMIEVMWGNTNALERLLTLLIIVERPSATLEQIEAALQTRGVDVPTAAVEEALDTLVLYSVLNKEDGVYSFTAAAFPSVVAATQDLDLLVERAIQYLGRETGSPDSPTTGSTQ